MALLPVCTEAHSWSDSPAFNIHLLEREEAFINNTVVPEVASSPSLACFLTIKPSEGAYILEYCWLKLTCCRFCRAMSTPVFAFCNCSRVATLSLYRLEARW